MPLSRTSALSRRGLLQAATALAALGVAGCAGGAGGARPEGPTRRVETHQGPVDIPANPQRVVCLDQYATIALLDVGIRPAATVDGLDDWMPAQHLDTYRALPRVGGYQPEFERVLAVRPDLIIGNSAFTLSGGSTYEQLTGIAPTVILTSRVSGEWQEMALRAADIVNRPEPMNRLRDRYLERAAEIRKTYAAALERTRFNLVASFKSGSWNLCLPDSWSGVVLAEAGCRFGSAAEGRTGSAVEQSYEQLGVLNDTDVLFYQVNPDGQVDQAMQALLGQGSFQNLPAVRESGGTPFKNLYVFGYGQALGALDELEAVLRTR
ncbi:iron-siderophore ABC transporter substrate-binding protein [Saccharopolyspora gloriosae]|uniref:Iron complex transport system substrate-binding protein n=1 Tax=Saccharopolyspora gloriosae TaxID=455344 RepID=A0A840NI25_9PSEU|nr:ABC transporter substrate-binding protein [Saccharopolyspora gloriosae]MBB5071530.1 iron complex transport system substrate-binding protein [Saccharopolyspora gloriosae]